MKEQVFCQISFKKDAPKETSKMFCFQNRRFQGVDHQSHGVSPSGRPLPRLHCDHLRRTELQSHCRLQRSQRLRLGCQRH
jgi:hypothetical protein